MGQLQPLNQDLDAIWHEAGCWVVSDVRVLQRASWDWAVQYAEALEVAMGQGGSNEAYNEYSRFRLLDKKAKS